MVQVSVQGFIKGFQGASTGLEASLKRIHQFWDKGLLWSLSSLTGSAKGSRVPLLVHSRGSEFTSQFASGFTNSLEKFGQRFTNSLKGLTQNASWVHLGGSLHGFTYRLTSDFTDSLFKDSFFKGSRVRLPPHFRKRSHQG